MEVADAKWAMVVPLVGRIVGGGLGLVSRSCCQGRTEVVAEMLECVVHYGGHGEVWWMSSALGSWEWTHVSAQCLPHTDGRSHGGAEAVDRDGLHLLE